MVLIREGRWEWGVTEGRNCPVELKGGKQEGDSPESFGEQKGEGKVRRWGGAGESTGGLEDGQCVHAFRAFIAPPLCAETVVKERQPLPWWSSKLRGADRQRIRECCFGGTSAVSVGTGSFGSTEESLPVQTGVVGKDISEQGSDV